MVVSGGNEDDDDSDDDIPDDKGKAPVVEVEVAPELPEYEIVASTPAPVLDFEAFLAMTKPRTPVPSPGLQRKR